MEDLSGPPVEITDVYLTRHGKWVIVECLFPGGGRVEVIRELHDSFFDHYATANGIRSAIAEGRGSLLDRAAE